MTENNEVFVYTEGNLIVYIPKVEKGVKYYPAKDAIIMSEYGETVMELEKLINLYPENTHILRLVEDEIEKLLPAQTDYLSALNSTDVK